jgi:hypothetical protein
MRTITSVFSAALVVVGLAGIHTTASADGPRGTRDPGVNARQHHQVDRTKQGVRSGELTRNEAKGIREDRRDIRQKEREYKSDGTLTREERKDLHKDMNQASRDIYKEKHDAEKR